MAGYRENLMIRNVRIRLNSATLEQGSVFKRNELVEVDLGKFIDEAKVIEQIKEKVKVIALGIHQVPVINSYIINVTEGAYAYRFIGNTQGIKVKIPVDRRKVTDHDAELRFFYFDMEYRTWKAAEIQVDGNGNEFIEPNPGAEYFAGLIKAPKCQKLRYLLQTFSKI
ncbi:hypothetical protein [Schleiferia thermophila]|jgi:hypothetical protein|uniref:hypothetical protein n=1 Tax=Schleiferia thermophila TaxID=884107 RepID=UPI000CBC9858|nr:hypothetical protein CEN47_12610 [Fischerella thermalis CCMEE 5319]